MFFLRYRKMIFLGQILEIHEIFIRTIFFSSEGVFTQTGVLNDSTLAQLLNKIGLNKKWIGKSCKMDQNGPLSGPEWPNGSPNP